MNLSSCSVSAFVHIMYLKTLRLNTQPYIQCSNDQDQSLGCKCHPLQQSINFLTGGGAKRDNESYKAILIISATCFLSIIAGIHEDNFPSHSYTTSVSRN